ncbi:MAG: hypothetical protein IKT48_07050 [Anaerotignum sp.]|nr:hypothetical protein [Anaerotignum sp.]
MTPEPSAIPTKFISAVCLDALFSAITKPKTINSKNKRYRLFFVFITNQKADTTENAKKTRQIISDLPSLK